MDAEGVNPAAAVAPGRDVLKIAEDLVALVLLEKLVGQDRIARFRAGVDAVEEARLLVEVESKALEVLVPVGKLDGDLDLGVHRPCRLEEEVIRGLVHQIEAELRPRAAALGGDVGVGTSC